MSNTDDDRTPTAGQTDLLNGPDVTALPAGTRTVRIIVQMDAALTEAEIWPDRDAPAGWDADQVRDKAERDGGLQGLLYSWNLVGEIVVSFQDDLGNVAYL